MCFGKSAVSFARGRGMPPSPKLKRCAGVRGGRAGHVEEALHLVLPDRVEDHLHGRAGRGDLAELREREVAAPVLVRELEELRQVVHGLYKTLVETVAIRCRLHVLTLRIPIYSRRHV